jgi:hypothetical protein
MSVTIIGIDCATVDKKIGLAHAQVDNGELNIVAAWPCDSENRAARLIADWLKTTSTSRALLAIDAPLGWPTELSSALVEHYAGQTIQTQPARMFRRATDRYVIQTLKKVPLEVGADRIARTAHFALSLLGEVRRETGQEIPLAWNQEWIRAAAVEVYPAATLLGRGLTSTGYKKRSQVAVRQQLVEQLRPHVSLGPAAEAMVASADVLDAVVCAVAGGDFVRGLVHFPIERSIAEREGWIWFRAAGRAG